MLRKLPGIFALTVTLLFIGCATTHPVYDVTQAPVVANKPNPTMDEIRQAIVRAGITLGWQMNPDRPGHVTGRLLLRTHVAVVDVDYTEKAYSIKYKESTNLDYGDGKIHRNYNGWIQNLDKAIRIQLQNL